MNAGDNVVQPERARDENTAPGGGDISPEGSDNALSAIPGTLNNAALDALIKEFVERPWQFDFFHAVRRLENTTQRRPRVGHSWRLSDDPLRFCQETSLAFAPSTISACIPGAEKRPTRLFVKFLGLTGPFGPLPLHISEYVYDREHQHADPTPARFFDVFNHRAISLFYRAWAINQQTVSFERKDSESYGRNYGDRFSVFVASVFGQGTPAFENRDAVPDLAKLYFADRLSNRTKNAEGLSAILQDYFGVTTRIEQFVGQWIELPAENRCQLGRSRETGTVGSNLIVGARMWDCQQKFRIVMGAMTFETYQRLLPGGKSLVRLAAWVRNYVGDQFCWDLQLVLRADQVPRIQLGRLGQLGWSTWVGSNPHARDADDLRLRPRAA